jgi:hypothetical protein
MIRIFVWVVMAASGVVMASLGVVMAAFGVVMARTIPEKKESRHY